MKSRQALVVEQSRRDGLSIRQLGSAISPVRAAIGASSEQRRRSPTSCRRGSRAVRPTEFNVMPSAYFPGELDAFATLVVPELQRRGLFRRDYEGRTLRDHLGLKRPA